MLASNLEVRLTFVSHHPLDLCVARVVGNVEVGLVFLPKVLPVLVVYRQVDFEVRLAVEAESVVGMDQAAAVEWIAAE